MGGWRPGSLQPLHGGPTAGGSGQPARRPFTADRPTQVSSGHNGRVWWPCPLQLSHGRPTAGGGRQPARRSFMAAHPTQVSSLKSVSGDLSKSSEGRP
jgi:hypothetical protein